MLFCFLDSGCQYQCSGLPGKTRLLNDLLCVTHSFDMSCLIVLAIIVQYFRVTMNTQISRKCESVMSRYTGGVSDWCGARTNRRHCSSLRCDRVPQTVGKAVTFLLILLSEVLYHFTTFVSKDVLSITI